jgi:hypothetical protein
MILFNSDPLTRINIGSPIVLGVVTALCAIATVLVWKRDGIVDVPSQRAESPLSSDDTVVNEQA